MTLPGFPTRPGDRPSPGELAPHGLTGSSITGTTLAVDGGWLAQENEPGKLYKA
jgi:hypothetical protein